MCNNFYKIDTNGYFNLKGLRSLSKDQRQAYNSFWTSRGVQNVQMGSNSQQQSPTFGGFDIIDVNRTCPFLLSTQNSPLNFYATLTERVAKSFVKKRMSFS